MSPNVLKKALAARQLRAQGAAEVLCGEPIAILGMACRFPGAENLRAYWELLAGRIDATRDLPDDRFDELPVDSTGEPLFPLRGGFLDRVDLFDPGFFQITPREAVHIDPQHRLMLECAWHALEDAALAPRSLAGRDVGVFVGVGTNDYGHLLERRFGIAGVQGVTALGNIRSAAAGRLSYFFDFQGPSLTVDTACSSSLVALHQAMQSLRNEECSLALAAGVNLILSPENSVLLARMGALAPDGRCKSFDASADGFGRGEGCGVVVLERLSDAIANRNPIRAVLRGSAVNQDGRSAGLSAPNQESQRAVIRAALRNGGVAPSEVSYVECHGTGTHLGDPIETEALATTVGAPAAGVCYLGTAKANLGHLEAAAGMAGLIKVVLSLEHERLPGHPHLQTLNPQIRLEQTRLEILRDTTPWPRVGSPRIAGLSSFGFTGTNAHVIVQEAPAIPVDDVAEVADVPRVLCLSARTAEELGALVEATADRVAGWAASTEPLVALRQICATAACGRTHFSQRAVFPAASVAELLRALRDFAAVAGGSRDRVVSATSLGLGLGDKPSLVADAVARFAAGGDVAWSEVPGYRSRSAGVLPPYPFRRLRCWPSPAEIAIETTPLQPLAPGRVEAVEAPALHVLYTQLAALETVIHDQIGWFQHTMTRSLRGSDDDGYTTRSQT